MKRLFLLAIVLLWAATVSATIFIPSDSTDVSTTIFIEDKADGTTETGLTVTDFDLYYHIDGAAMAAKVDATSGSATAHTENSAIELGIGVYEIDWPDAIFASRDPGTLIDLIVEWDASTHYAVVQQVQITPSVNTLLIEGADATTTLGTAQTGDSYALVNNETYGLSAIQGLVADANDSCDLLSNGTYGLAALETILGMPADTDIATDIANVKAETTAILADTGAYLDATISSRSSHTPEEVWEDPNAPTMAATVDGVSLESVYECLLAFMAGKATVTDLGSTRTITYYKQDGSTAKFAITIRERDGSRAATGTLDP